MDEKKEANEFCRANNFDFLYVYEGKGRVIEYNPLSFGSWVYVLPQKTIVGGCFR